MEIITENGKVREKEYIESGRWKCAKSPTGAHHWHITEDQMVCIHCKENRRALAIPESAT